MTAVVTDTHTMIWYWRDHTRCRIKETGYFPMKEAPFLIPYHFLGAGNIPDVVLENISFTTAKIGDAIALGGSIVPLGVLRKRDQPSLSSAPIQL